MTVLTIGSVAGSPGATTVALGLAAAWPDLDRRRVVVEVDPDGGRLGAELGIGVEPGLMALALAVRTAHLTGTELVDRAAADLGGWHAIPAPASSEQTHSALVHAAGPLAAAMAADHDAVWLVDAGRLSTRSAALPFARIADRAVVVSSGSFPMLQLLPHRIDALRAAGCAPCVVIVEPTSWPADEVADFVGADIAAILPRITARRSGVAGIGTSAWRPWWRAIETAAEHLAASRRPVPLADRARP
jgi:MinD-like ATPase involved in chromosome partitioning or flagellar assembly